MSQPLHESVGLFRRYNLPDAVIWERVLVAAAIAKDLDVAELEYLALQAVMGSPAAANRLADCGVIPAGLAARPMTDPTDVIRFRLRALEYLAETYPEKA